MPPQAPMMAPVHSYAVFEVTDREDVKPIEGPVPTPRQVSEHPGGALELTGPDLVRLFNQLSAAGALGPVIVLGEGVLLIGELAGFAMIELDRQIVPGTFAPGLLGRA